MTRRYGLLLICLLTVAVLVRLLPVAANWDRPLVFLEYDSWGYHQLGVNLHAGHGYSAEMEPPYLPNVYRPPGLPVLLAGLYSLTGDSAQAAILLQHAVALLTVVYSRNVFRSPISVRVRPPFHFRSWVFNPMHAKGKISFSRPRIVWPSMTTWECNRQLSPRTTCSPITQYGPMSQPMPIWALGWMIAVG